MGARFMFGSSEANGSVLVTLNDTSAIATAYCTDSEARALANRIIKTLGMWDANEAIRRRNEELNEENERLRRANAALRGRLVSKRAGKKR